MPSDDSKPTEAVDTKDEQSQKDSISELPNAVDSKKQSVRWKDTMEEWHRPVMVWSCLIVWIAFCTVVVYGFYKGIAFYVGGALIGGLLLGIILVPIILIRKLGLWWLAAWLYLMPPVMWFFVGHYNGWRDYLILVVILLLVTSLGAKVVDAVCAREYLPKWARSPKLMQVAQAGVYLLLVWIISSATDHFMGPFWTPQPPVLQGSKQSQAVSGKPEKRWVAVALSGGGFRAAIMHTGVLDALEKSGFGITALSTVSGGSIIGGFYALGGTPERFKDTVIERRFNLRRDLFNIQNLVRLPMPGLITFPLFERSWEVPLLPTKSSFTRTDVLANQLTRVLYGDVSIRDAEYRSRLLWIIGTTDILSGDAVGISANGVYRRAQPVLDLTNSRGYMRRKHSRPKFEQITKIQPDAVSEIVAASCAFPGALAPITGKYERATDSKQGAVEFLLADGGLTDNSGIALLLAAWKLPPPSSRHPFDVIIASNGGKSLQRKGLQDKFSRPFRALDVIYAASGVYVPESEVLANEGPDIVQLTPERTLPKSSKAVKALIEWAGSQNDDSPPIEPDKLSGFLEQELPDEILYGLNQNVESMGRPKHLAESWHRVIEKSQESAFDDQRLKAKLDVVLDFIHVSEVFEQTSTLNDILPKDDVEALFRLGRYLVHLRIENHDQ